MTSTPPPSSFHKLRMRSESAHGKTLQVWLDDTELRRVTSLELKASVGDAIRLKIEMFVEIDGTDLELPLEIRTKT